MSQTLSLIFSKDILNNHNVDQFRVYSQIPEIYDAIYGGDDEKSLEFVKWMLEHLDLTKSSKILDMGAGTGSLLIPLTQMGYEIEGIEPYEGMIAQAIMKSKAFEVKIRISQGSFENLDQVDKYDMVLAINGPLHFVDISRGGAKKVFSNVFESLQNGGYFLIDLMNYYSLIKNYKYPEIQHFEIQGSPTTAMVSHNVDLDREKWIHHTVLFVKDGDNWERIDDIQEMSMYSLGLLQLLGNQTGFEFLRFFSSYDDRPDNRSYGARLIALFRKTVD